MTSETITWVRDGFLEASRARRAARARAAQNGQPHAIAPTTLAKLGRRVSAALLPLSGVACAVVGVFMIAGPAFGLIAMLPATVIADLLIPNE